MGDIRPDTLFNLHGRNDWSDEERMHAYSELFRSDLGRAVLADIIVRWGITQPVPVDAANLSILAQANGSKLVAWDIVGLAGLNSSMAGVALVSDQYSKMKHMEPENDG